MGEELKNTCSKLEEELNLKSVYMTKLEKEKEQLDTTTSQHKTLLKTLCETSSNVVELNKKLNEKSKDDSKFHKEMLFVKTSQNKHEEQLLTIQNQVMKLYNEREAKK